MPVNDPNGDSELAEQLNFQLELAERLARQRDHAARYEHLAQLAVTIPTQEPPSPLGQKASVNSRMLEAVQTRLAEVSGWTAKQWSELLKCSPSTVVETPTWKDLSMVRQRQRAERSKAKHRRGKGR